MTFPFPSRQPIDLNLHFGRVRVGLVLVLAAIGFVVIFLAYAYMSIPIVQINNFANQSMNMPVNGTIALNNLKFVWDYFPLWAAMAVLVWAVARALRKETVETGFDLG